MEMEHINENLIKVLIGLEDLEERGIDFLDLIGDQSSIEQFFYSILEEVDVDKHFQGSEAVTFQVMPNQDGLELYISRTNLDEMENIWEDELTKQLIKRKQKLKAEKRSKNSRSTTDDLDKSSKDNLSEEESLTKVEEHIIRFESLEDFIVLARQIMTHQPLESSLYKLGQRYYLLMNELTRSIDDDGIVSLYLTILEFGEIEKMTPAVLEEYGHLIRYGDALTYFGQNF